MFPLTELLSRIWHEELVPPVPLTVSEVSGVAVVFSMRMLSSMPPLTVEFVI